MRLLALVGLLALLSIEIRAQSCVTQSFVGFDSSGNLLTLFNVSSAKTCCGSCATFEECVGFVWSNQFNGTRLNTTTCVLYNSNSQKVLSNNVGSIGGAYQSSYKRHTSCSSSSDTFYNGPILKTVQITTSDCCTMCSGFIGCNYWVTNGTTCWFLTGQGQTFDLTGTTSGTVIPNSVMRTPLRQPTKRGLGIFGTNSCSDLQLLSSNVSWVFNWDTQPGILEPCMAQLGLEYIPSIATYNPNVTEFQQYVNSTYTKSQYLMTFTNPNFLATYVSPAAAAAAWPMIEQFADQYNMSIGLPSASVGGSTNPIAWISQFMSACSNCRIDFVAINYFTCDTTQLTNILTIYARYNLPIWLASVTCTNGSVADVVEFMEQLLPLLDGKPNVARYAWYGTREGVNSYNLFNYTTCDLTAVGLAYTGLNSTNHTNYVTTASSSSTSASSSTTFKMRSTSTANGRADVQSLIFYVLVAILLLIN